MPPTRVVVLRRERTEAHTARMGGRRGGAGRTTRRVTAASASGGREGARQAAVYARRHRGAGAARRAVLDRCVLLAHPIGPSRGTHGAAAARAGDADRASAARADGRAGATPRADGAGQERPG